MIRCLGPAVKTCRLVPGRGEELDPVEDPLERVPPYDIARIRSPREVFPLPRFPDDVVPRAFPGPMDQGYRGALDLEGRIAVLADRRARVEVAGDEEAASFVEPRESTCRLSLRFIRSSSSR